MWFHNFWLSRFCNFESPKTLEIDYKGSQEPELSKKMENEEKIGKKLKPTYS